MTDDQARQLTPGQEVWVGIYSPLGEPEIFIRQRRFLRDPDKTLTWRGGERPVFELADGNIVRAAAGERIGTIVATPKEA